MAQVMLYFFLKREAIFTLSSSLTIRILKPSLAYSRCNFSSDGSSAMHAGHQLALSTMSVDLPLSALKFVIPPSMSIASKFPMVSGRVWNGCAFSRYTRYARNKKAIKTAMPMLLDDIKRISDKNLCFFRAVLSYILEYGIQYSRPSF